MLMRWLILLLPPVVFLILVLSPISVGAQPPTPGLPPHQTPSTNPYPEPDPDCGNCFLVCTGGTPTPTRTPTPTPTPVPTPTPTLTLTLTAVGSWYTAREGVNRVHVVMNAVACGSSRNNESGSCSLGSEALSHASIDSSSTSDWGTGGAVTFVAVEPTTYTLEYDFRSHCGSRGCGRAGLEIRHCGWVSSWPWDGSASCSVSVFSAGVDSGGSVTGVYSLTVAPGEIYRVGSFSLGGAYGDPDRGSAEGLVEFFSSGSFQPPTPTPTCAWEWASSPPGSGCEFHSSDCLVPPCQGTGDADFSYSCGVGTPGDASFSLVVSSTSPLTVSFNYAPEVGLAPAGTISSSVRGTISPPPGVLIDSSSSGYSLAGDVRNMGSAYVAVDCGAVHPSPPPPPPPPVPGDECHPPAPPGCRWVCNHPVPRPERGTCYSWDVPPAWAEGVLGPCHTYRICLYDIVPQLTAVMWPITYFVSRLFLGGLVLFYGVVLVLRYVVRR